MKVSYETMKVAYETISVSYEIVRTSDEIAIVSYAIIKGSHNSRAAFRTMQALTVSKIALRRLQVEKVLATIKNLLIGSKSR